MLCPVCNQLVQDTDSRISTQIRFLPGEGDTEFVLGIEEMTKTVVVHRKCSAGLAKALGQTGSSFAAGVTDGLKRRPAPPEEDSA